MSCFFNLGSASTCSRTDNANGNQNYCGTKLNTGAGNGNSIDICGEYSFYFIFQKSGWFESTTIFIHSMYVLYVWFVLVPTFEK